MPQDNTEIMMNIVVLITLLPLLCLVTIILFDIGPGPIRRELSELARFIARAIWQPLARLHDKKAGRDLKAADSRKEPNSSGSADH